MPFCTWTQCLRDLSLEKGALKVVCCNKRTKSWTKKSFLFDREGLLTKKSKKKITKDRQKEWMNCMYGAWWIGDTSRTADTLVLYKNSLRLACVHCECLRLAHSPMWPGGGGTDAGVTAGRWTVWGCCHVAVDWMGLWGEEHLCFCPVAMWGRGREENLPVWHPNRGSGFFITHSLRSWV